MLRQLCNSLRYFSKPALLCAAVLGCCLSGCQLFQQPAEEKSNLRQTMPNSGFREQSDKPSWNRGGWSSEAQEIEKSLGY